jgi:hypothetical protein
MKILVEASDIGKRDDVAVSFDLDGTDLTILVEKKVRTEIGSIETHVIDTMYVNVGEKKI